MNKRIYKGLLTDFLEIGLEGVEWILQEESSMHKNGSWDINGVIFIDNGDHLTIFKNNDYTEFVWQGNIIRNPNQFLGYKIENIYPLWIPENPDLNFKEWKEWFYSNKYWAILTKFD